MAKTSNIVVVLIALLATTAAVVPSTEAADHVVGDSTGWIVPPSTSFYSEWAANQTFATGDVLVFNFLTGRHTVARTSKAGYDSCDLNAATNTISTAPAEVTLDEAAEYYFICTVPGHCATGQKLAVTVAASSGTPKSDASPSPSSGSSNPMAPPPASSASSLVASFSIALVSAALALFY